MVGELLVVALVYGSASFLLYRARVQSEAQVWNSDSLVFYRPGLVTLVANVLLFWRSFRGRFSVWPRLGIAIGLAFVATFAAAWCWTVIAFSLYGT